MSNLLQKLHIFVVFAMMLKMLSHHAKQEGVLCQEHATDAMHTWQNMCDIMQCSGDSKTVGKSAVLLMHWSHGTVLTTSDSEQNDHATISEFHRKICAPQKLLSKLSSKLLANGKTDSKTVQHVQGL